VSHFAPYAPNDPFVAEISYLKIGEKPHLIYELAEPALLVAQVNQAIATAFSS
jgi:hypothetical protein